MSNMTLCLLTKVIAKIIKGGAVSNEAQMPISEYKQIRSIKNMNDVFEEHEDYDDTGWDRLKKDITDVMQTQIQLDNLISFLRIALLQAPVGAKKKLLLNLTRLCLKW